MPLSRSTVNVLLQKAAGLMNCCQHPGWDFCRRRSAVDIHRKEERRRKECVKEWIPTDGQLIPEHDQEDVSVSSAPLRKNGGACWQPWLYHHQCPDRHRRAEPCAWLTWRWQPRTMVVTRQPRHLAATHCPIECRLLAANIGIKTEEKRKRQQSWTLSEAPFHKNKGYRQLVDPNGTNVHKITEKKLTASSLPRMMTAMSDMT